MEPLTDVQKALGVAPRSTTGTEAGQLGQEQFLKLLIAQLKNQDPGKPMENGEFLTQIAQFQQVTGIANLEKGFDSLAATLQRNQLGDAAAMIGRDVLYDTSAFVLSSSGSVDGQLSLPAYASNVKLHITDAAGGQKIIDLGARGPGGANFSWNGEVAPGVRATSGAYEIVATAVIDGIERSVPVQMYGHVDSVALNPNGGPVELQLDNGLRVSVADVYEFK